MRAEVDPRLRVCELSFPSAIVAKCWMRSREQREDTTRFNVGQLAKPILPVRRTKVQDGRGICVPNGYRIDIFCHCHFFRFVNKIGPNTMHKILQFTYPQRKRAKAR
jgi:hypothetical protein